MLVHLLGIPPLAPHIEVQYPVVVPRGHVCPPREIQISAFSKPWKCLIHFRSYYSYFKSNC